MLFARPRRRTISNFMTIGSVIEASVRTDRLYMIYLVVWMLVCVLAIELCCGIVDYCFDLIYFLDKTTTETSIVHLFYQLKTQNQTVTQQEQI